MDVGTVSERKLGRRDKRTHVWEKLGDDEDRRRAEHVRLCICSIDTALALLRRPPFNHALQTLIDSATLTNPPPALVDSDVRSIATLTS